MGLADVSWTSPWEGVTGKFNQEILRKTLDTLARLFRLAGLGMPSNLNIILLIL